MVQRERPRTNRMPKPVRVKNCGAIVQYLNQFDTRGKIRYSGPMSYPEMTGRKGRSVAFIKTLLAQHESTRITLRETSAGSAADTDKARCAFFMTLRKPCRSQKIANRLLTVGEQDEIELKERSELYPRIFNQDRDR